MMKITGLSHLFKWEDLHNWWLTKYFFAPLTVYRYPPVYSLAIVILLLTAALYLLVTFISYSYPYFLKLYCWLGART